MNEEQLSASVRSRLLSEVIKHLQAAADLFDYLKDIDDKMCLNSITTAGGRTVAHLERK